MGFENPEPSSEHANRIFRGLDRSVRCRVDVTRALKNRLDLFIDVYRDICSHISRVLRAHGLEQQQVSLFYRGRLVLYALGHRVELSWVDDDRSVSQL